MKKVIFLFAIALMAGSFYSCEKNDDDVTVEKQYVEAIAGEFVAVEGDITLKSADLGKVTRTWSTYTNNANFYSYELSLGNPWVPVDGREFITGLAAYNFWSDPANNPISFPANQSVYSNLTPDEDLRMVFETKNADGEVAYLGINDFNPSEVSFPLTVNGYRLGDVLTINTDALTSLPGFGNLEVEVAFNLAPINLDATKMATFSGTPSIPNGTEFVWADIVYGTEVSMSKTAGSGDYELYNGLTDKVMGKIKITITEPGNPDLKLEIETDAQGAGKGLAIKLLTDKIGWFDSKSPLKLTEKDIKVEIVYIKIN